MCSRLGLLSGGVSAGRAREEGAHLSAENDVLGAEDYGLAGDLVAGVLEGVRDGGRGEEGGRTVSMYSPLVCLGGIVGDSFCVAVGGR